MQRPVGLRLQRQKGVSKLAAVGLASRVAPSPLAFERRWRSGELEVLEVVLEGGGRVIIDRERIPLGVGDGGVGCSRRIVAQKGL